MSATAGPHRLFTSEMGNEISWLLPVALFVIAFGVYSWARRRLDTGERAALIMWGGWLLVTGAVFSFMNGTVHPYYTVALAPAIGALVGLGAVWGWRDRATADGRIGLVGHGRDRGLLVGDSAAPQPLRTQLAAVGGDHRLRGRRDRHRPSNVSARKPGVFGRALVGREGCGQSG